MKTKLLLITMLLIGAVASAQTYDILDERRKSHHKLQNLTEKQVDSFLHKNKGRLYFVRTWVIEAGKTSACDLPHYEPVEEFKNEVI